MPKRPADPDPEPADRLDDGVEHLQAAAHEMVAAARSFLDVVEEVVSDREKLGAVTASVTELLGNAGGSLARLAERFTAGATGAGGGAGGGADGSGDPAEPPTARPRLRRIEVE